MSKKFVIIDAMALAYKAYFVFINRPLVTTKGEPTSAVYGFLNQFLKILEDTRPEYVAVAFDSKEKTFRHEKYEDYKSNRSEMPDDMMSQIDRIKEIIEVLKIPIYIIPRYEADDIIGTAVCKAEEQGFESYVVTPDKDFNQLVTDKVKIVRPGKSTDEIVFYDVEKVKDEFGFEPKQMIDYLALIGDSSDNIPGVDGIGPKTAIPLIQKYGSIEEIYNHLDEIEKPALKKKLIDGEAKAFISKELATIHCGVPLNFDFDKAKFIKPDFDKLRDIFLQLEFKNLYSRLLNFYSKNGSSEVEKIQTIESGVDTLNKQNVIYTLVTSLGEAKKVAEKLSKSDMFVFDTETDSLDHLMLRLAGVSFSLKPNEAYYVALNSFEGDGTIPEIVRERLPLSNFINLFKPVFENKKIKKVCQNAKFDISVLRSRGIEVNNFYFDTMLASYVIDPDQKHGLEELSIKYLNYKPIPLTDLIGPKKDSSKIFDVDLNAISDYSCEDADITFRLFRTMDELIKKEKLEKVAYEIEFPLIPVLEDMERTGIRIDTEALISFGKDLQVKLDEYTEKIYNCCGEEFNISSPIQLQKILFDKLKLNPGKKTKTGFSTDAQALEAIRGEHEIIELILDFRQAAKLKSTYADSLPALIHPKTGRIHTCYNQTVASTGRLSSIDPNLQNIPIRTEMGKEIRRAFVPRDKDHFILSADYSQIELRILANITGDEGLTKAFISGEDIHRSTASLVFMVPPEEVTPEMRRRAKEVNFGVLYGIGPYGLKTRLGITQTHAKEIIETYFRTFNRVKNFMDECVLKAREKGFAETINGRRRFLRNINSNNRTVRQFEERVAINMPIQGSAADMIKLAMINIYHELNKMNARSKMVLQVHDELVFDVYKDEVEEVTSMVKEKMESAILMKVPIQVETGIGDNWLDAH